MREVLPNVLPTIVVLLSLEMGIAVIVEAILSFVNLSISTDDPTDIVPAQIIGEGADTQDKATTKALTAAYKYALLQTFAIGEGDGDGDAQSGSDDHSPEDHSASPEDHSASPEEITKLKASLDLIVDDDEKKIVNAYWKLVKLGNQALQPSHVLSTYKSRKAFVYHRFRLAGERFLGRWIDPSDLELVVQFDDRIHGAAEEPADFFFPLAHLGFGLQSLQLRRGSRGKDLKYRVNARLLWNRSPIDHRHMP